MKINEIKNGNINKIYLLEVDNNNNINNTINEIDNELRLKKILLKRR